VTRARIFKVKRSKVNLQGDIQWRPPTQLVIGANVCVGGCLGVSMKSLYSCQY